MQISTVTSKYQATIPLQIRTMLGIHKGDAVGFEIEKGKVTIKRIARPEKEDIAYLKLIEASLAEEWGSDEDDELFRDL